MKKHKFLFWIILLALSACELLLSWRVKGFSDFYVKHIFPIFTETYGRIAGITSISIGEILLYAFVVYVPFTVIIWMSRFVAFCDKKDSLKKFNRANTKFFFKLLIFIALVQVQNCFVLYHTSTMYEGTAAENYVSTKEDLISLREMLVKRANTMAEEFKRDSKGEIVYDADLGSIAKLTMQGMGENAYKRVKAGNADILDEKLMLLKGYYSPPKPFYKSDFFSQQYICGYYFPFSLEANYNNLMYIVNIPNSMCHELSHLKGFIFEDEATFLAYLACMNSEDNLFIYSGTMNALSYVESSLKKEILLHPEIADSLTPISELVSKDSVFLTEEAWAEVNADALLKTEDVYEATETFLETNLTLNGVEDGIISYSRMVNLLLKYYFAENE